MAFLAAILGGAGFAFICAGLTRALVFTLRATLAIATPAIGPIATAIALRIARRAALCITSGGFTRRWCLAGFGLRGTEANNFIP